MKYKYKIVNPRIPIKFISSHTEEELFEIRRIWTNLGEIYTNHMVASLLDQEYRTNTIKVQKKVLLLAAAEFELVELEE